MALDLDEMVALIAAPIYAAQIIVGIREIDRDVAMERAVREAHELWSIAHRSKH